MIFSAGPELIYYFRELGKQNYAKEKFWYIWKINLDYM